MEVTQIVHMTEDNGSVFTSVELCIDEEPFDIGAYLDIEEGGIWESDYLEYLNDTSIDPSIVPEGVYTFVYTVTQNDCVRIKEIVVDINDNCIYYPCIRNQADVSISKMVTPNNDGYHDFFEVSYILNDQAHDPCSIETKVVIFNRWGNKVYESNNYANDWGGNSPGSAFGNATELPSGSYYYIVTLKNSGIKPIQGYIFLGVE
jgi:gliding motility-associated-like protein